MAKRGSKPGVKRGPYNLHKNEPSGTPKKTIRSFLVNLFKGELKPSLDKATQDVTNEKTKENRDKYLTLKAEDERLRKEGEK